MSIEWNNLHQLVDNCTSCDLHKTATNKVFGGGNPNTAFVGIIGEAPGAEEDKFGYPFVGRSGKLLREVLFNSGFVKGDLYVMNTLKCRPTDNRDPNTHEKERCRPWLHTQISLLPNIKALLMVGRISANGFLEEEQSMKELRGKWFEVTVKGRTLPAYTIYHPAYILRSSKNRPVMEQDVDAFFKKVKNEQTKDPW